MLNGNVCKCAFGNFAFFVDADFVKDIFRHWQANACFVIKERICGIDLVSNFDFRIHLWRRDCSGCDFEMTIFKKLNPVDNAGVEFDFFDIAVPNKTERFCGCPQPLEVHFKIGDASFN